MRRLRRRAGAWLDNGMLYDYPLRRFNVIMRVIEHGSFTLDNYVKYYCTRTSPDVSPSFYLQYDHDHNMNPTEPCAVFLELSSYAPKLFEDEIGDEDLVLKWLCGGIDGCVGRRVGGMRCTGVGYDSRILRTATDRWGWRRTSVLDQQVTGLWGGQRRIVYSQTVSTTLFLALVCIARVRWVDSAEDCRVHLCIREGRNEGVEGGRMEATLP